MAETGGSAALTALLKDEEARLHGLETKLAASQARRPPPKRATDVVRLARAFAREPAELLGLDRDTTRATLVAMLEPMRLTPGTDGPADFYEVTAKYKSRPSKGMAGKYSARLVAGAISALKQSILWRSRRTSRRCGGMSCSEEFVRVREPRLLLES